MRLVSLFVVSLLPAFAIAAHVRHPLEVYTDAELAEEVRFTEKLFEEQIKPLTESTTKRNQHPKDNGCIEGVKVVVSKSLPEELRVGIFQPGAEYEAVIRSSSARPDPKQDDRIPAGQGMFLKVLFTGEHEALQKEVNQLLPYQKHYKSVDKKYYLSQDFITITEGKKQVEEEGKPSPYVEDFFANKPVDYVDFFAAQRAAGGLAKEIGELLAKAKSEGMKSEKLAEESESVLKKYKIQKEVIERVKAEILGRHQFPVRQIGGLAAQALAASYLFNDEGKLKRPREAAILQKLGAMAVTDPLTESYHSFVPSAYGEENAVKYLIHPETEAGEQVAFPEGINKNDKDYLREVLKARLRAGEIRYTLSVAFYPKDTKPNTLEDAAVAWKLKKNPTAANRWAKRGYVPVATIVIPQKKAGEELMDKDLCEFLPSSPSRGLVAHRGVGGVQRARDIIYPLDQNVRMDGRGQIEISGKL